MVWALHGGGEVAAARVLLDAAARVARPGEAKAVERLRGDAWAPARQKKAAGKPLHGAGVGAVGGRRRNRAGVGKMVIRAILQFPKVSGTFL